MKSKLKIDPIKLYEAVEYINKINKISFIDLDLSDLFDDKIDLTDKQKEEFFWVKERESNINIISDLMKSKNKQIENIGG